MSTDNPIKQTENWFKAAVDKTDKALMSQIACHIEEFRELLEALGYVTHPVLKELESVRNYFATTKALDYNVFDIDVKAVRDAIADSTVTGIGVLYQLGYSLEEDLKAVADSNDSKFADVNIEDVHLSEICDMIEDKTKYKGVHYKVRNDKVVFFDENGKIMKNPITYKEPVFKD